MADATKTDDVLIVGAGPVGLTAALALTRGGARCRIVDRNESRTDKSKALVLWSRTLELLDGLGGAARFVVRPDGYVSFRALPADEEHLLAHLDVHFVPAGSTS
jgi:2-polyprenyl-6-methoxyphenol hydroxylase-like FAD-dependent oxidoreductase